MKREEDPSLRVTEGLGSSPSVKKSKVQASLTIGEDTEGAGFSPGVKKPMAITKGEKGRGVG